MSWNGGKFVRPSASSILTVIKFLLASFLRSIETLVKFAILPFDDDAARVFHRLKDQGVRIGTMDLKIASICIARDMTLLSRNLVDFEKVPGRRVENWLD